MAQQCMGPTIESKHCVQSSLYTECVGPGGCSSVNLVSIGYKKKILGHGGEFLHSCWIYQALALDLGRLPAGGAAWYWLV
jgi:hypothetical protein